MHQPLGIGLKASAVADRERERVRCRSSSSSPSSSSLESAPSLPPKGHPAPAMEPSKPHAKPRAPGNGRKRPPNTKPKQGQSQKKK